MYVYTCVYVYVCTRVCMYVWINICHMHIMCVCMYACMYPPVQFVYFGYIHTCVWCVHACIQTWHSFFLDILISVCVCVCVCVFVYVCVRVCTWVCMWQDPGGQAQAGVLYYRLERLLMKVCSRISNDLLQTCTILDTYVCAFSRLYCTDVRIRWCVCVCICIYIYIYIYVFIYLYIYVFICIYVCVYVYTYKYMYTYTCMHLCKYM